MTGLTHTPQLASSRRDVRRSPKRKFTAVDLFSGAGGLSYAFHTAGFRILAAVEKDQHAAETYRTAFISSHSPHTVLIAADVRAPDVMASLKALLNDGEKVDIVVGGPPCQDFSPARLKQPRKGNRTGLVPRYFQLIGLLRPRAFLFENVPGLKTAAQGKYWRVVTENAERLGYTLNAHILCADRFGVPQRRQRLFVVGTQRGDNGFVFPVGKKRAPSVMDAIGHLPRLHAGEASADPMHRARRHTPETVAYLAQIPQGGAWREAKSFRTLKCHEGHSGHYDVYGRMRPDEIAPTITGGCTNPSKGRFIHPEQDRGLTVREAALLQTFPPSWHFCGGVESQSLQVGNAVPIKLGRALALALRATLQSD